MQEQEEIEKVNYHTIEFLNVNGIDASSGIDIIGDEKTYDTMLKDFYSNLKQRFNKIIEDKASNNLDDYLTETSSLKKDSNYYGLNKLYELAKDQEINAKLYNYKYLNEHFKEYQDEIVRVIAVLERYFES